MWESGDEGWGGVGTRGGVWGGGVKNKKNNFDHIFAH